MLANGIYQTTTTTGTGDLTLSAVTGFPPFSAKFSVGSNGDPFRYAIVRDSDGVGLEWGIGHLSASNTLVRDKIEATWNGTTYSDLNPSALSLSADTYRVICCDNSFARPISPAATDSTIASPRYLMGAQWSGNPGASITCTANTMYLVPFRLDIAVVCSGVSAKINTAATTGALKNMRAALYSVDKNGHPGNLIAESSATSVASTGVKAFAFPASVKLAPGHYFVALCTDSNAAPAGSNAQGGGGQCQLWGVSGGDPAGRIIGITKSLTYADSGALFPNPLGTTGLTYGVDWGTAYHCPTLMVTS